MALQQLTPAQQVSEVELPRPSDAAEASVDVGSHMQLPQELDHALLHTERNAGVQSPCMQHTFTVRDLTDPILPTRGPSAE